MADKIFAKMVNSRRGREVERLVLEINFYENTVHPE